MEDEQRRKKKEKKMAREKNGQTDDLKCHTGQRWHDAASLVKMHISAHKTQHEQKSIAIVGHYYSHYFILKVEAKKA